MEQSAWKERLAWNALAHDDGILPVAQTFIAAFICLSGENPMDMGWRVKHGSIGISLASITEQDPERIVRSDDDAISGIQVLCSPLPPNTKVPSVDHMRWGIWGWPGFEPSTISGSR
jgi:hypothetical protein